MGDTYQFTYLHPHALIFSDHVRLDYYGHVLSEYELPGRPGTCSPCSQDRRQVSTSKTMHKVVVYSEARVVNVFAGIQDILAGCSRTDYIRDAIERLYCHVVHPPVFWCGRCADGERAQDLSRIAEVLGAYFS